MLAKANTNCIGNVIVIGAGGIGYHLAEPLVRFISFTFGHLGDKAPKVYIIDGDTIEAKNIERQHTIGYEGRNKAEVLTSTLTSRLQPKCQLISVPHMFSPTNIGLPLIKEALSVNPTVFSCVDNDATRFFIETTLSELPSATMISGGNDFSQGQAQLFVRRNKKNLTPLPSEVNPEIAEYDDQFPDEVSCSAVVESHPQLLFVNYAVASAMLNVWLGQVVEKELANQTLSSDALSVNEVMVDVRKASAHQFKRSSLRKQ